MRLVIAGHVSRDSETDFTLDSEQSTTEDFHTFNPSPMRDGSSAEGFEALGLREGSVSPEPARFERTGLFYKSTRFRGGSYDDDMDSFRDFTTGRSSSELENIPEKYFVTVSGFDATSPGVTAIPLPKPRNVTEV